MSGVERCKSAAPELCGLLVEGGEDYCRRYLQHGGDHVVSVADAVRMDMEDPRSVNVGVHESAVFFRAAVLSDLMRDLLGHLVLDQRTMMLGMVVEDDGFVEFSQVVSDDSLDNRVLFSMVRELRLGRDLWLEFPEEMVEVGIIGWMLVVDVAGVEGGVPSGSFRVASFIGASGVVFQQLWSGRELSYRVAGDGDDDVVCEVLRRFYRASHDQLRP